MAAGTDLRSQLNIDDRIKYLGLDV
jgi:hypothetical protein